MSESLSTPATIIVAGHLTVGADDRDDYLRSCEAAVAVARDTDGCLDFAVSADTVDPTRINVYERWRDRPALEAFRAGGPDAAQTATLLAIEVAEFEVQPAAG